MPFDAMREDWEEPVRRGSWWPVLVGSLLFWGFLALALTAAAPPQGMPVLNQVISATTLTASNTATFAETRAIQIGDAAACSVQVRFASDPGFITLTNVQTGIPLPYSIVQLGTGTACNTVFGLY